MARKKKTLAEEIARQAGKKLHDGDDLRFINPIRAITENMKRKSGAPKSTSP